MDDFKEVSKQAGLDHYANAITAIAFDYDNDADLDLFIGSYFQPVNVFEPDTPRFFPENFETANNGGGLAVFRNNDDGTFDDVTRTAGFNLSGWTLDLGHADYDNDGDEDLYVAADFGTDRLFRNEGDGAFTDVTEQATGIDTKKGMNVDWADYDNDGFLDVYVTNITDDYMREGNFLWRNNGDGTFLDVSRETSTHETGWGWGAKFFDYDNDGLQDLYVVNGWVSAGEENYVLDIFEMILQPDFDMADARSWPPMGNKSLSGYQRQSAFPQRRRRVQGCGEASRLDSKQDGRGIGIADLDSDGRMDVIVANAGATPLLFRNHVPQVHHWVQFRLRGTRSSKSAVGARVTIKAGDETQIRFVDGGNSFAGQSSARLHFGLGSAKQLESVAVRWPGGTTERFPLTQVDRTHTLVEGKGQAVTLRLAVSVLLLAGTLVAGAQQDYEQAQALLNGGNLEGALDSFEAALRAEPASLRYGSEYRQAVIQAEAYDRCLAFFEELTAAHPRRPQRVPQLRPCLR